MTRKNDSPFLRRLAGLGAGLVLASTVFAAESPGELLLTGTRIYVSPDTPPIDGGAVLVRDGKIAAVGAMQARGVTPSAECSGGVVMAGFQNSHVHFMRDRWSDVQRKPAAELNRSLAEMLTRYGYTTVVDTGSNRDDTLALRTRIERGELEGPRILMVGEPLFPPQGIPIYLLDLPAHARERFAQPADAAAAVAVVGANFDAGANGTKLFLVTPQRQGRNASMPREIARAAAERTHRRGGFVMAHPTNLDGVRAALDARVDVLTHTTLGSEAPWPDELLRDVVAADMAMIPTLKLLGHELKKQDVPDEIAQRLTVAALKSVGTFVAAGGTVVFGTDVGYMTDFDPTEEYVLLARAGLDTMQILASLTTTPAARWGESERRGRLRPGMDADIVVLGVDPASDPGSFASVRCTIRGGRIIYAKTRS